MTLRYNNTIKAPNVNKSGNKANGPSPNGRKPKAQITNGLDTKALSKSTMRKMNQNLVWATGYNVVAIPIAAGILVPVGIMLPLEVAAITMSLSSISVTINALLL